MEIIMKDNLNQMIKMDLEKKLRKVMFILVNGKIILWMEWENISGLKEKFM